MLRIKVRQSKANYVFLNSPKKRTKLTILSKEDDLGSCEYLADKIRKCLFFDGSLLNIYSVSQEFIVVDFYLTLISEIKYFIFR